MTTEDRQTGRTTRLLEEAERRGAWFVVHCEDAVNYASRLRPSFPRKDIVSVFRAAKIVRGDRRPVVIDHAVFEHAGGEGLRQLLAECDLKGCNPFKEGKAI